MRRRSPGKVTTDQLIDDFKVVIADAEALLKATANQGDAKLDEVRTRAEKSLKEMKAAMGEAQSAMLDQTKEVVDATDAYVHENPWTAIGMAAGIGLLIGLLNGRS